MASLFELAMPWWEFVLRAAIVYVALLVRLQRLAAPEPHPRFLSGAEALVEAANREVVAR